VSDQEILSKAVKKAIAGGWDANSFCGYASSSRQRRVDEVVIELMEYNYTSEEYEGISMSAVRGLIFSHDFCAAIWPEKMYINLAGEYNADNPEWKWQLQRMVVADDPLKYLGNYV
jgi:hypothetical protein